MDCVNSGNDVGLVVVDGVVSTGSVPVYCTVVRLRCVMDAGVEVLGRELRTPLK